MAKRGRPRKNKLAEVNEELERLNTKAQIMMGRLERLDKPFDVPPILPSQKRTLVLGPIFTFSAIFAVGFGASLFLPIEFTSQGIKILIIITVLACSWLAGRELRTTMLNAGYKW